MNGAFVGSTETILLAMFGDSQQDEHVKKWRWAVYTNIFARNERSGAWYLKNHGADHVRN